MILHLEPVFNNIGLSKEFSYELDFSKNDWSGELIFRDKVKISGSVMNRTGVVELKAVVNVKINTFCCRCAAEISKTVNIPMNHVLVSSLNNEDNDELILVENYNFNLDELVSEDIFLELPERFLCSEDCKGICQSCGKNLNNEPCSCLKPSDPRLDVLRQLLDD